jgi:tungstate transport system substrate-binding protein
MSANLIKTLINRRNLICALPCLMSSEVLWAQQRKSLIDPLRVGVDLAPFESGLGRALQRGFGRETGVAVQLVRKPAMALLEALERGELDTALVNAPKAELKLAQQGLVHSRKLVATSEFVIVGPTKSAVDQIANQPKVKTPKDSRQKNSAKSVSKSSLQDPAGIIGSHDAADALRRIREEALIARGTVIFLSAGDGSGVHVAEQALWRTAQLAPAAPWYVNAEPAAGTLIQQAKLNNAYALVARSAWASHGGAPLSLLVEGDANLQETVHVMHSFHQKHPAAKLFAAWITGPKGRRVVAANTGYRLADA